MKVAMIGFGGLGRTAAEHLRRDADIRFVGVATGARTRESAQAMLGVPIADTPTALLALQPDIVVECASHAAFRQYAEPVLASGTPMIAVSVGVLADFDYRARLFAVARKARATLQVPSGAIGAIDAIAAARHARLIRVVYSTRKNAAAWAGTAAESMVDLKAVREPRLFFDNTAERAALLFSEKANVTATLALAGVGFEKTRVQLWVDPAATRSMHHIEAEGAFGTLALDLANNVGPDGKSSFLTAMSIVRAVRNRTATLML